MKDLRILVIDERDNIMFERELYGSDLDAVYRIADAIDAEFGVEEEDA